MNMSNFFLFLDEQADNQNAAMDLIRLVFGVVSRFVYDFVAKLVDILYHIALVLNVNGEGFTGFITKLTDRLFVIILIYMIFRGKITMLNYIVDPESFQDKAKCGAAFIKRIIISIVLLISINPIFNFIGTLQNDIIDSEIITNVFTSEKNDKVLEFDGTKYYFLSMSEECYSNYLVATTSKGDRFSLELLKPFMQPAPGANMDTLVSLGYCGADTAYLDQESIQYIESETDALTQNGILSVNEKKTAKDFLGPSLYNSHHGTTWPTEEYNLDFNFFMCLIAGIVVFLILISFTFDVVIRAFNLIVLKVLAPIPIIAYMSPKGKESEMLGIWIKKVITTWASLFIRLIALEFALSVISIICDGDVLPSNSLGLIESVLVICGALMFAKKLPQLLEEIIPGFKLSGGFELNPFKRISKDALGGNMILGAAAGAGAMALGAATNFGQRAVQGVNEMSKATNTREALRSVFGGAARTVGSTVAGGARAGINAFNRTRKDGNLFGGLSKGYQTSMFSKKLREDNLRKVGILNDDGTYADGKGFMDSVRFGMASVGADVARYAGVMNAGQREILDAAAQDKEVQRMQKALADQKRHDAEAKANELKPYELYTEQAVKIKNRLKAIVDNDGRVKTAQADLEHAIATGTEADVAAAQRALQSTKRQVRISAFQNDEELVERVRGLEQLQKQYKTQLAGLNLYSRENGVIKDVDDNALSRAQYEQEKITNKYKGYEAQYAADERRIEEYKNSEAFIRAHDENSMNKMGNASRINNEVEGPGVKPAPSGSSQAEITDEARFHLGRNANMASRARTTGGSRTNPPPPPPPPGGAIH